MHIIFIRKPFITFIYICLMCFTINAKNFELFNACVNNQIEIVEKILAADTIDINKKYNSNMTLLMYASYLGYEDMVKILLKNNVDINIQDEYGRTALLIAQACGYTEITKLLEQTDKDNNIYNIKELLTTPIEITPKIISLPSKITRIYNPNIINKFITYNNLEYCYGILDNKGTISFEQIIPDWTNSISKDEIDCESGFIWNNKSLRVRITDYKNKDYRGFPATYDHKTNLLKVRLIDREKKLFMLNLADISNANYGLKFILYDFDKKEFIYQSDWNDYEIYPFFNGSVLVHSAASTKNTWFFSDYKVETRYTNKLTDTLSKLKIAAFNILGSHPFRFKTRSLIGISKITKENQRIFIRWNQDMSEVTAVPITKVYPDDGGFLVSSFTHSFDEQWTCIYYKMKDRAINAPRVVFYHVDEKYPLGLSIPIIGGYSDSNQGGAFIEHEEWGTCYLEAFEDKLYVYKMNDVKDALLENAAKILQK